MTCWVRHDAWMSSLGHILWFIQVDLSHTEVFTAPKHLKINHLVWSFRHLSGRNVCEIPTNRQLPRNLWLIPSIFCLFSLGTPTHNISNTFCFLLMFRVVFSMSHSLTRRFSTNFPQFHFSCVGLKFYFLVFDFLLDFFSSLFLFFADELLNANDKISRSSSSNPIRNNTMHYAHSHNVNLIQSTSSSITNLMASTETIASGAGPGRSKYAKKGRKRQKRRRKRNWTSFRASSLFNFLSLCDFLIFVEKGKKNLKNCSYLVGRRRWSHVMSQKSNLRSN